MSELSKAKTKAWNNFSKYIRLRDAIKTTKTKTHLRCITCDKIYPAFGKPCAQAGHFVAGRKNAILFEETNVHGQCYNCNITLKGNGALYWLYMEKTYGREEIDRLMALNKTTRQIKAWEFLELAELYKNKYNELYNQL